MARIMFDRLPGHGTPNACRLLLVDGMSVLFRAHFSYQVGSQLTTTPFFLVTAAVFNPAGLRDIRIRCLQMAVLYS